MPCRNDFYCGTCRTNHDYSCPIADAKQAAILDAAQQKTKSPHPAPESFLCEACELLEDAGLLSKASEHLRKWYANHEACEADRLRYEAALKLSARELRVLGIDLAALKAKVKTKAK